MSFHRENKYFQSKMRLLMWRVYAVLMVGLLSVGDGGGCLRWSAVKPPASRASEAASDVESAVRPSAKVVVPGADVVVVIKPVHFAPATRRSTAVADDHNRLLVQTLTDNFVCPNQDSQLLQTVDSKLPNCTQSTFKQWALSCVEEDVGAGASTINQTIGIVYRTAILGQKCRHAITCQWPPCQHLINPQVDTTNEQTLRSFQEHIVNNIMVVIKNTNRTPCQQFTDAEEIWQDLRKQEISSDYDLIFPKLTVILSQHIIDGKCLRTLSSSAAAEMSPNAAERNDQTPSSIDQLYEAYLDELFLKYSENKSGVDQQGIARLLIDTGLIIEGDNGTEPLVVGGTSTERRRRAAAESPLAALGKHLRLKRSTDTVANITQCLDSLTVLSVFDKDTSNNLSRSEFLQFCSYIVYHISNGHQCNQPSGKVKGYNRAEVYGYGTLAVFLVSACSALGFVIIPLLSESIYEVMMTAFIALAFGTLTGDALMHMLPDAMVAIGSDTAVQTEAFYKALVITFSIYILFFFEGITQLLVKHSHGHDHGPGDQHGHSHTHSHEFIQQQTQKNPNAQLNEKNGDTDLFSVPSRDVLVMEDQTKDEGTDSEEDSHKHLQELILNEEQSPVCLGLTSLALVIIIGDAIHNVTDGISIGASFASDLNTGFSTSLAVFFHELPHEFGDFVILLTTGLTLKKALIWNIISSLSAFLGLYVGIIVGENEEANQWIFAVTAGMFLYVAIADMLPEMRNIKSKRKWWAFFAQNLGALVGMGFMIFMHYLEDLINF